MTENPYLVDEEWHKLSKDEGIRFTANQPHGYRNLMPELATFHDIIHYPEASSR